MPLISFRACGLKVFPTVNVVDYRSQSLVLNECIAISHVCILLQSVGNLAYVYLAGLMG